MCNIFIRRLSVAPRLPQHEGWKRWTGDQHGASHLDMAQWGACSSAALPDPCIKLRRINDGCAGGWLSEQEAREILYCRARMHWNSKELLAALLTGYEQSCCPGCLKTACKRFKRRLSAVERCPISRSSLFTRLIWAAEKVHWCSISRKKSAKRGMPGAIK